MSQNNSTFTTQNSKLPKRIFLSPPHMSGYEQQFIAEAFESNYIAPLGPQVDAFEKEFAEKIGIPHALALSSGTAAMHLALHQIGVREGDEVIASTLTFIGSVSPVTFLGGKPVFIDADYATWNMDPNLLAEEINFCDKKGKLPKAVVPTDLYGQCADLDRILEICEPYGIPVIIDAAEALGAVYYSANSELGMLNSELKGQKHINQLKINNSKFKIAHHAGVGAKAAIFSFNGNKIITTSGGGMLVSEDKDFIDQARFLSQQARDDAPHYEHSQIGFNYRMSNILAAIGRGQLKVLDDRVEAKRQIFEKYKEALKDVDGIEFMPEAAYGRASRWLTVILITPHKFGVDRETVRLALEAENIEAKPVWKPMHLQPVFDCGSRFKVQGSEIMQEKATTKIQNSKFKIQNYPARVVRGKVAEDLFKRGLCLPSGTAMTDEDIGRVVSVILNCRGN
ncbi:aminotransferase class I/II-fold pyridoxal phosphate-dependent enzyme [Thermodesulfovibrionales bacterium]|nr:aminotransferase class I/II-fold pyridoxal phosphate-dependent enzyme [Thermodesulfovibrionales bacterium]